MRFGIWGVRTVAAMVAVALTSCDPGGSATRGSTGGDPPTPPRPSQVARITCGANETRVDTPVVEVRSNRLRVEVTNRTGEKVIIYGLPLQSGPGVRTHLVRQEPGMVKVACIASGLTVERFEPQGIPIEIVAPTTEPKT